MYSAVPPAIENSTFRFHRCNPTTAAEASSSGAPWVPESQATFLKQYTVAGLRAREEN